MNENSMQPLFDHDHSENNANSNLLESTAMTPWQQIYEHLKSSLDQQTFSAWITPLRAEMRGNNQIVIFMPNMVFYQTFVHQFQPILEQTKHDCGFDHILTTYEISGAEKPPSTVLPERKVVPDVPQNGHETSQPISRALDSKTTLNNQYDFGSFVKGPSNQFAHATCMAVADAPGQTYNPLFIYGSTGLGKTHLLHAVGWSVLQKNPKANICYITSERFMNEMIYCLRFNKMWDFRKKYRNCDLFLVDDIQFISGKDRTQEEFFHTFNALYESKKQIVMTSDKFPQDISDIEDRLRNRFQWGLIADIQPPDVEHRVAILLTKAEMLGLNLAADVALYIANHAKRNVRELEGALHRIAAYAALQGRQIDLSLAKKTFHNILGEPPKTLTIETIQKLVAEHFKVRVSDLKSKKRQRAISVPRQVAMYIARIKTTASFPEIGSKFGGKDHTTVMHAVNKIKNEVESDLDLKTHIEALERKLEQHA